LNAAEESSADDKRGHPPARDTPEDEPASAESWRKRLKHRLASTFAKMLMAAIARLQALRARLGEGEDESEERPRAKTAHPLPPKVEVPPPPPPVAEAHGKKPHKFRNLLIIFLLILVSGGIGTGVAYSFFSRLLRDQSLAIDSHEQELRGFQLEEQEQGRKLAEVIQQREAERKLRTDMEARLVEAEQRRLAAEAGAKQANIEPAKPQLSAKPDQHPEKEPETDTKIVGRPSKASTFRPPATKNCSLAGSDPASLRRCIDEYNRK